MKDRNHFGGFRSHPGLFPQQFEVCYTNMVINLAIFSVFALSLASRVYLMPKACIGCQACAEEV